MSMFAKPWGSQTQIVEAHDKESQDCTTMDLTTEQY